MFKIYRQKIDLFLFSAWKGQITSSSSPCGDWIPFKHDKCFKIFDKVGLQSFDDARKTCSDHGNSSRLIQINSLEEQEFVVNYLFQENHIVDNVWLGAKFVNNKFKWEDNSDMDFTYWANGLPINMNSDYCVSMHSFPEDGMVGKWADVLCSNKNQVSCEKKLMVTLVN